MMRQHTSVQDRYSRQERFLPIGVEGQRRIQSSRVLIVGAGALGSGLAEMLVRAGVGSVTIIDRDYVEWSNLQRQQLYCEQDAEERLPKAVAAERRLRSINSNVHVQGVVADVTVYELKEWARNQDLILDATDNFDTRLLLNDYAMKHDIPWIYGACVGSYGMSAFFKRGLTPCLSCMMDAIPVGGATCDTAGIISPAVQMTISLQAAEALKWLAGKEEALRNRLVSFDLWSNQYTSLDIRSARKENCTSCGSEASYPYLDAKHHRKTEVLCGRDSVQLRPAELRRVNLSEVAQGLKAAGLSVQVNPFLLSFEVDEKHRVVLFADGRILIHGTKDMVQARIIADRLFG